MTDQDLPPAEFDVIRCLWDMGAMTARELREMLASRRPMSHSSVCTLLNRLSEKGIVAREKASNGKAFVYSAIVGPTRTRRRVIGDVVDRVFNGSGVDLIASLFETKPPSAAELTQLQSLLDELMSKTTSPAKTKRRGK